MPVYMNISGVSGDVTNPNYLNWIELNSFQWGGNPGTSSINNTTVTKTFDSSSSTLFYKSVTGANLGLVVIAFLKTDQGGGQEYLRINLSNTMIASYVTSGSNPVTESIGLNSTKIEQVNSASGDSSYTPPGSPSYDLDF